VVRSVEPEPARSPVQRLLLLDRNRARPRWLLVAQLLPSDSIPARLGPGHRRYEGWSDEVARREPLTGRRRPVPRPIERHAADGASAHIIPGRWLRVV